MGDNAYAQLSIRPTYKVGEEEKRKPQDLLCINCRHSNHLQADFEDGFIYCKLNGMHMGNQGFCKETILYRKAKHYMFEAYNGTNCTWNWIGDIVI